jgi:hypothetical protein
MSTNALAAYQARLLAVLFEGSDGATMRELLLQMPESEPWRTYVSEFDPGLVEVAAELMRTWAVVQPALQDGAKP